VVLEKGGKKKKGGRGGGTSIFFLTRTDERINRGKWENESCDAEGDGSSDKEKKGGGREGKEEKKMPLHTPGLKLREERTPNYTTRGGHTAASAPGEGKKGGEGREKGSPGLFLYSQRRQLGKKKTSCSEFNENWDFMR